MGSLCCSLKMRGLNPLLPILQLNSQNGWNPGSCRWLYCVSREKSDKEIMREIQAIMRQLASSITYLPCLDDSCVFDVFKYCSPIYLD
ncbi:hypothetical protein Q3G72_005923 [Acer saccharum]|nr:hypothetical protein Q3G72_005923 [Acer saccharum]